jgi:hypothetical protein
MSVMVMMMMMMMMVVVVVVVETLAYMTENKWIPNEGKWKDQCIEVPTVATFITVN